MSDKSDKASEGTAPGANAFTDREIDIMAKAWFCLKTGAPEVDYAKLAAATGMTNPRSASNAWGKIRQKLNAQEGVVATPKLKGTPKKKGESNDPATPTKSPRKRAPKKQDIDGEASPKKKGRSTKVKAEEEEVDESAADNAEASPVLDDLDDAA